MERILNPSGGRPIKNEDIKLFEQFISIFEGIGLDVRNPLYIYGCKFNGTGIDAGLVYFDGDLCIMDAQAFLVTDEFEKQTIESEPREYFDGVTKNSIETIKLVPQVGGSFTYNADDPDTYNFASYMHLLASAADVVTAENNDKVVTPSSLLSGLRSGTSYRNTDSVWGVARRATTTEGRSSTDNEGFLTSSLLKDAFQFGNFLASTTLKGVIEKATGAEFTSGATDKYPDASLLQGLAGGTPTGNGIVTLTSLINRNRNFYTIKRLQFSGNINYSNSIIPSGTTFISLPTSSYDPAPPFDIPFTMSLKNAAGTIWYNWRVVFTTGNIIQALEDSPVTVSTNVFAINLFY